MRFLVGLVVLALVGLTPADRPQGFSQHYVWKDARGEHFAEGVFISRSEQDRQIARWMVTTPERNRVTLTSQTVPAKKSFLTEIRDRETGWWAELQNTVEFKTAWTMADVDEFVTRLKNENPRIGFSLRTQDGFLASTDGRAFDGSDPVKILAAALAADKEAARLSETTSDELRFLATMLERRNMMPVPGAEDLINILRPGWSSSRASAAYDAVKWERGELPIVIGDKKARRAASDQLLARFGVGEGDDPLADMEPDEKPD